MFFKEPKNTKEIYWTKHVKEKMHYYGLSEGRLRRILKSPQRREKGIAPRTIALMQPASPTGGPAGTKKPSEIWLMYQQIGQKKRMISAWRYPGISPLGEPIPVPDNIIEELKKDKKLFLTKKSG
jgi:hypothetical protein